MTRVEDMLQKMMRRFDASDEHTKELRSDLANIGQKVDAHAISIKHLELQMAQLSSTVNPHQAGNLPSNTVQNQKMMDIVWQSLLEGIRKPLTHLRHLA